MLILDTTTKSLEVVLAGAKAAADCPFTCHYVDLTSSAFTPASSDGTTNGVTAVTVAAAPAASTQRQVKLLSVFNADSAPVSLTVRLNNNGTCRTVWAGALAIGETLTYADGAGFAVCGADGAVKYALQPDNDIVSVIDGAGEQAILQSELVGPSAGFALVSGRAYWVYIGYTKVPVTVQYVEFNVSAAGSGAQTAEVALGSSANPPNKSNQTVSKLAATGALDALTSTGLKRNSNPLNCTVPAGTHLWLGIRTAMATTQPSIYGLAFDFAQGHVLSTDAAGPLTDAGPWTGSIIAAAATAVCPGLRATLG